MKPPLPLRILLIASLVLSLAHAACANPDFAGRWRLDTERSSPLDGWHKMDLVIAIDGSEVALTHDMQWRDTKRSATNVLDTARPVEIEDYFRVAQRHMAVYPAEDGVTRAEAGWIDHGTLRLNADIPLEVSQGIVHMRIYSEYRISELGDTLTLIELHSTRNRPLVYVFNKVNEEVAQ